MKIFGFGTRKENKKATRRLNRGQYKIVSGWGQSQIEPSSQEIRTEDQILDPTKRAKLLDVTRNLVRNSSLFNTILGQLTTNVVSSCGGKVILNYRDEQINHTLRRLFADYTRNADFYSGATFNHLLKRILREVIIGGDCVLLFDDGLIEDSGKLCLFEAEEIVDVPEAAIQEHYGNGAFQIQGKVYNQNGRHIGTVVSRSQRGVTVADPSKCYFLSKNPNANPLENLWFQPTNSWRDGRGISQAASAVSTIHQLEDLVSSELMAARRNSQIFCWLTQKATNEEELPSAFDSTTDFDNMTEAEIENAVKNESEQTQTISFQRAKENSVVYEALPENVDAKQLQTTHPNDSVETMVNWLASRASATLGLSRVFVTGSPEDSNFRANQLMTQGAIVEFQKDLEQICDWVFCRFMKWSIHKGNVTIPADEDIMPYVSWEWKKLDSLDVSATETANEMKLKNMTGSYREIYGNDWRDKLTQIRDEINWFKANGLPHPSYNMISGGERTGADTITTEDENE